MDKSEKRNWAPVGLLMYEQSIKVGAFFKDFFFKKRRVIEEKRLHISKNMIRKHRSQTLKKCTYFN